MRCQSLISSSRRSPSVWYPLRTGSLPASEAQPDNNVRGSTFIDNRVVRWYGNRPTQTGVSKIAEKCIFGPNYGRMPNSQEWYIITGNLANWLSQEFPDNTTKTAFLNMASFINYVFRLVKFHRIVM